MEFYDKIKVLSKETSETKYVSIPAKICKLLKLNEGDDVKLTIEKYIEKEVEA